MRLKTYIGHSMHEVMALIRRELGSEAIIVSSVQEKDSVHVTAAIDQTVEMQKHDRSENFFLKAINHLMTLIEHQKVPKSMIEDLFDRLSQINNPQRFKSLEQILVQVLPLSMLNDLLLSDPNIQPVILIGPTGAGKTLTTVKLAIQGIRLQKPMAILSVDGGKSGAHEQLQYFARALNIAVEIVENLNEVPAILQNFKHHHILIDTPGLNPLQIDEVNALKNVIDLTCGQPILVIPAGLDPYEALDLMDVLQKIHVTRFIYTKTDTCRRFGALIALLNQNTMKLCAFGCGPEIGKLLQCPNPSYLIELLHKAYPIEKMSSLTSIDLLSARTRIRN